MLACGTAFNIFAHKLHKPWLPEFRDDKLAGFEVAGVAGRLVVMTAGEDRVAERILWGYVDMTLIDQDVIIKFPV